MAKLLGADIERPDAENRSLGNAGDTEGALGDIRPVDDHQADDFTEGKRHDRQIVAAQAQHREAENDAPERSQNAGQRQQHPEGQAEIGWIAARRNRRRPRRRRRNRDRAGRRGRRRCSGPRRASHRSGSGCQNYPPTSASPVDRQRHRLNDADRAAAQTSAIFRKCVWKKPFSVEISSSPLRAFASLRASRCGLQKDDHQETADGGDQPRRWPAGPSAER